MAKVKRETITAARKAAKRKKLNVDDITIGSPTIGTPAIGVDSNLDAGGITVGSPEIGTVFTGPPFGAKPKNDRKVARAKYWLLKVFPDGTGGRKRVQVLQVINDAKEEFNPSEPDIERDSLRRACDQLGPRWCPFRRT